MNLHRTWLAPWLALAAVLSGCGREGTPMLVSQDQEVEIGQTVSRDVEQEYGAPLRSGREVARTEAVFQRIKPFTQRNVPYRASVLDNGKVINAFACPGGPLYFTKSLVEVMDRDDQLAFVVGHETGHVEREHGRQAINQALLVNTAGSLLLGNASELAQFGAGVALTLYSQGYSRQQEREADSVGLQLMAKAGYRPEAAVEALQKLGGSEYRGLDKYLASHPSTPERIQRLQTEIQQNYR